MTVEQLFEDFHNKKIIVLGDVMIDAYMYGGVNRVSPEAPVPIVNFTKQEERLGGAANVALNLISLGAHVAVGSVVGKDKEGNTIRRLLEEEHISTEGLVLSDERITTVKTRIVGNHQQLLRIDNEQTDDITLTEENILLQKLDSLLQKGYDAIIFQDYNKGVLTGSLIQKAIALAEQYKVITTVDPKLKNFLCYKNVTLFKPNLKELSEGMKVTVDFEKNKDKFYKTVNDLKIQLNSNIAFVTMSQWGVYITNKTQSFHIPAHPRNIADVSGAGDTVISVATLCLCCGLNIDKVAELANLAGGIVCEYRGVVAINKTRFKEELLKLQLDVV